MVGLPNIAYTHVVTRLYTPKSNLTFIMRGWLRLPALALASLSWSFVSAVSHSFENTAIVRTIDLGGSLVHVTTTYAIRALDNGAQQYLVTLGEKEALSTSWFEAKLKGQNDPLTVTTRPLIPHESAHILSHDTA